MDRLEEQCKVWHEKINHLLPVDVVGEIESTVGNARLGMGKKGRFQQFRDLIDACELQTGEQKTTCADLQVSSSALFRSPLLM